VRLTSLKAHTTIGHRLHPDLHSLFLGIIKKMAAVLVGSTGLVVCKMNWYANLKITFLQGSCILTTLLASSKFTSVQAYSRKALAASSSKLQTIEATDSESWPSKFPSGASVFFSALGTTRGQAGGVEGQRKIDYDLNLELAKAAQKSGVDTYVLISSTGANSSSAIPYSKMKGELEEAVAKLGFKNVVVLRPGLIVGQRQDSRPAEYAIRQVASFLRKIGGTRATDSWAQDADVIAKAGVHAAIQVAEGKRKEEGVWLLSQADIVRLGRTEWVEEK
jgi:hypothetical protein